MARGGVNKATVQTARMALLARGEHPSIDAVRVEMGNTGSKTTIHRYLKELDETENRQGSPRTSIGDELTELVERLAQRLQSEAQERVEQAQQAFDTASRTLNEELAQTRLQLADTAARLGRESELLGQQTAALFSTREQLQTEQTQIARLTQANVDMAERLNDKDSQIRSLEDKHLHARDALDHYRNAVKEQRDQEQRRHEGQIQQIQMELRQAQQNAMVRQEEITQLNRDNERLLAETRSSQRELHDHQDKLSKASTQTVKITEQLQHAQAHCALLEERTRSAQQDSTETRQQLSDQLQQNRVLELILIKTELALENLRAAQPPHDSSKNAPQEPSPSD